jgi:hypothetical protein
MAPLPFGKHHPHCPLPDPCATARSFCALFRALQRMRRMRSLLVALSAAIVMVATALVAPVSAQTWWIVTGQYAGGGGGGGISNTDDGPIATAPVNANDKANDHVDDGDSGVAASVADPSAIWGELRWSFVVPPYPSCAGVASAQCFGGIGAGDATDWYSGDHLLVQLAPQWTQENASYYYIANLSLQKQNGFAVTTAIYGPVPGERCDAVFSQVGDWDIGVNTSVRVRCQQAGYNELNYPFAQPLSTTGAFIQTEVQIVNGGQCQCVRHLCPRLRQRSDRTDGSRALSRLLALSVSVCEASTFVVVFEFAVEIVRSIESDPQQLDGHRGQRRRMRRTDCH